MKYLSYTLLVVVIGYLIFLTGSVAYGSNICKKSGWKEVSIGFPNTIYCASRINQTDIIKPLSEIIK